MGVHCIQSLGQSNIASTEESTPKFLMYPMSWGKAWPPCLLGPPGSLEEQEAKAHYLAED